MSDLDALLAGIVAHPYEPVRWLIVADWLDDHGQPDRAELLRLHRMLIDTCCEPDQHPDRAAWQARIVELIDRGVKPCVPQHTLMLPGGVPLVGNFIPPGAFLMGSEEEEYEEEVPIHKVTLSSGFFMGIHPVTQLQWRAMMRGPVGHVQGDNLPVNSVSWEEAMEFCAKVTEFRGQMTRLPTEAEWEYACRAGTTTDFHWGDTATPDRMNYDSQRTWRGSEARDSCGSAVAVRSFAENPWGLFDLHGGIRQWCMDWYSVSFYGHSPETDPVGDESRWACRSVRGGGWGSSPEYCRAAYRGGHLPTESDTEYGFRVAFTLS